jgi:cellulase/cellobiase CelA1
MYAPINERAPALIPKIPSVERKRFTARFFSPSRKSCSGWYKKIYAIKAAENTNRDSTVMGIRMVGSLLSNVEEKNMIEATRAIYKSPESAFIKGFLVMYLITHK